MGAGQVLVSIGWAFSTFLCAAAGAQPMEMDTCSGNALGVCGPIEAPGVLVGCDQGDLYYSGYVGRIGWLLRAAGPITIELETLAAGPIRFPLYVEIVPLLEGPPFSPCTAPGYVVMHAYGTNDPCHSAVERSPVIDITDLVPVGGLYALRIYFLGQPGQTVQTPFLRCARVISQTAVARETWGHVKALFK